MSESIENAERRIDEADDVPSFEDVLKVVSKPREEATVMAEELGKRFSQEQLSSVIKDAIIQMLDRGDFGWPKFALELFPFVELDNDIKNAAKKVLLKKIGTQSGGESEIFRIMRWFDISKDYLQTKLVKEKVQIAIINFIKRGDENLARQTAFDDFGLTEDEYNILKSEAKS